MKHRLFSFGLTLILSACASGPKSQKDSASILADSKASAAQSAKKYPFEEFYKTAALWSFKFSPDNKSIYYLKTDGKVQNVFRYTIANGKTAQVTKFSEQVSAFIVDPTGKNLFLMKDVGGSELYDVFLFDLRNGKEKNLSKNSKDERSFICDVTNDGSKLYFSQSRNKRAEMDIKFVDLKTFKVTDVLRAKNQNLSCGGLSLNDDKMAFSEFVDNNEIHVGVLDLKTGEKVIVNAEAGIKNSTAGFDLKDDMYYTSTKGSDKSQLWKYNSASKTSIKIDWGHDNSIAGASVLAHGTASAIAFRDNFETKLAVFNGAFETPMSLPAYEGQIKGANFSKTDKNIGVITVSPGSAPEQYFLLIKGQLKKIFDSNQSRIAEQEFARPASTYVKSFDGTPIPTHFFIPAGTQESSKLPVIFWIHGGPEDHVDPEYSERMQFLANQGFMVVAPNVRGSTGFGKKYQFMDNGDWGGGHIKDIVSIADYVKQLSFVDSNRVYLLGGSFGGFSVMSLITQYPNVFRAAVNIFGVVEMKSFIESWPSSVVPYWLSELGKDPRTDEAFNKAISPIYHIQNIKIPLQVHQGENDIRVPKAQSDLLVEKMKAMGKPVEYHVYAGEGHGFTKFDNSKRCFTRIVDFFSRN
jgi:dipeptidyl aminopeptidase/acylaminoacyl peptidase